MCLFDCQRASLGTKEAVKVQPHQCVESYLHATCRDLHAEFEFGSWPGTKAETQLLASLISTLSDESARGWRVQGQCRMLIMRMAKCGQMLFVGPEKTAGPAP